MSLSTAPARPDPHRRPWERLWGTITSGYDRNSFYALGILAGVYATVGLVWSHLIDLSRGMDWLLLGIWAFMTAVLCWRIEPRRDLVRAGVGFVGGLLIEAWGTATEIWSYYTHERPPLWIIPAWPVAALAIDRLASLVDALLPRGALRAAWWLLLPPFVAYMTWFARFTLELPATQIAVAGMILCLVLPKDTREDACLFLGGAALGIFLEYWGTSRWCWRYYTREVPPPAAVLAHGFASVAFARGAWGLEALWATARSRTLRSRGEGAHT